MMALLTASLLFLGLHNTASAQTSRVIQEGIPATKNVILVATATPRVYLSTRSYSGSVSAVGLFTSSNIVISKDASDRVVLASAGWISAGGEGIPARTSANTLFMGASASTATFISQGQNTNYAGKFQFFTANSDSSGGNIRMHIENDGTVGIGNTAPAARLEVTGALNARSLKITSPNTAGQSFGPLITAGTNASDESLNAQTAGGSSLLLVKGNGIISGASQPGVNLYLTANQTLGSGNDTPIYWGGEQYNVLSMHSITTSSQTVTIPTGAAGIYFVSCNLYFADSTSGYRLVDLYINNATQNGGARGICFDSVAGPGATCSATMTYNFAAGDTIYCNGRQTSGAGLAVLSGAAASTFSVQKLW